MIPADTRTSTCPNCGRAEGYLISLGKWIIGCMACWRVMTIPQRLVFMSETAREVRQRDASYTEEWEQLARAIWAGWGEEE